MTGVLAFLELLGCNAAPLSQNEYARRIEGLAPAVRDALAERDISALAAALDARAFMACSIWAPDAEPSVEEQMGSPIEEAMSRSRAA